MNNKSNYSIKYINNQSFPPVFCFINILSRLLHDIMKYYFFFLIQYSEYDDILIIVWIIETYYTGNYRNIFILNYKCIYNNIRKIIYNLNNYLSNIFIINHKFEINNNKIAIK